MISLCHNRFLLHWIAVFGLVFPTVGHAEERIRFSEIVAPSLEQNCLAYQSDTIRKGNFSLASKQDLIDLGHMAQDDADSGCRLQLVSGTRPEMPKQGKRSLDADIAKLREWSRQGAEWLGGVQLREPVPVNRAWSSSQSIAATLICGELDEFVMAHLETIKKQMNPPTNRGTPMRPATCGLAGLPLTLEQVASFVKHFSFNADKWIFDRLCSLPENGERWGRQWLDILKFDESNGFERNGLIHDPWSCCDDVNGLFDEEKPLMIRYPLMLIERSVCDQDVELDNMLAIFASIFGDRLPVGAGEDSCGFQYLLDGHSEPVRESGVYHLPRSAFDIRVSTWKLLPERGLGGFFQPRHLQPSGGKTARQLSDTPEESAAVANVWRDHTKLVREIEEELGDVADPLERQRIQFRSTADQTEQEAIVILPDNFDNETQIPMVVSLHSWSGNLTQRNPLERLVHDRGWVYLFPNFRGVNQTPAACGSPLAQQDILDAVDWMMDRYAIDRDRIYLTGTSGGGHMTMLMAARYPERWKAASAWVGISDLSSWHARHQGSKYGNMLEKCCGGAPGDSPAVDAQYLSRSPLSCLSGAKDVALDISAGIRDGHQGSVPIRHSIDAFNEIAKSRNDPVVSEKEIAELSTPDGRLHSPQPGDLGFDQTFGRKYFLRRQAGPARLTIFDGAHEGIASGTMAWFESHQ